MWKKRLITLILLVGGFFLGYQLYGDRAKQNADFRLGLDLSGGSHLVYKADVSELPEQDVLSSMDALRDVIEQRINAFGVAEPDVFTQTSSISGDTEHRLVVELPGVTDLDEAVEMIGQTPFLEFKTERSPEEREALIADQQELLGAITSGEDVDLIGFVDPYYKTTELTGKYLESAQLQFSQAGVHSGGGFQSEPIVAISFNKEGAKLFEDITRENVGKTIAIYLDGRLVSAPRVNVAISGGQAIIEGNFSLDEAKTTAGRLNSGALPIPIELLSTSTVGASLGLDALQAGIFAGFMGLVAVAIILMLWYRLPGFIAVIALAFYSVIMLSLFKFIPVTLTSAGITGFIISIGIAVDANILIFERVKEELLSGKSIKEATEIGFSRAWSSIRDANISSIISAVILFWAGTSLVKGFALTFGIGILVSMFTAVTFTRYFLLSLSKKAEEKDSAFMRFMFLSGLKK